MVTKTRDKLIEVARQLFAYKGIENTTMNDIANASEKGRRTIYTYFRNKREIYNAVIERESEQLVARLITIVASDLAPAEKLRRFLETRFDIISDTVKPVDKSFRSFFSRDFRRVDRIRRLAVDKEQELFRAVITEGVSAGVFDPVQAKRIPVIETFLFQGVDYSHLRNNFKDINVNPAEMKSRIVDFVVEAVTIKNQ